MPALLVRRAAVFAVPLAILAVSATRSRAQGAAPVPAPAPSATDAHPPSASPATEARDEVPRDFERLLLDDARVRFVRPAKGRLRIDVHGELQIRYEHDSPLKVSAPIGDRTREFVGQESFALTWLRLGAQITYGETLKVVLQGDLLPRWILGDVAQGVSAAGDHARDERVPAFARLRFAYLDWTTPIGLLRLGRTGNSWGMGILANGGDKPMAFGDYRFGSIVERALFATRPFGKESPFVVAIAGDAVVQDATAKWADGDRAYQGVLSAFYEKGYDQLGFFGTRRWHDVRADRSGAEPGWIRLWVADVAGRIVRPVAEDVFAFGAFEVAHVFGKTTAIRSTPEFNEQDVNTWGGAAQVGLVKRGGATKVADGSPVSWGKMVAQLEAGYASGDANPYDGTVKRFTFDPNHQVGLVLFPYMMHFLTARSATNALDEGLTARPMPGSHLLASKGGVFGASYVNPTFVVRPTAVLDLKVGAVVAVASSDVVDPYRTATASSGGAQSYRGGSPKSRDLGVELDAGVEWRVRLSPVTLQIGAQAGVLLPGRAFDDAKGNRARAQSVVQGRLGVQF